MWNSNNLVKKIIGTKRFGGKKDLDFDGVPNRKDCQPRNTMRQDKTSTLLARIYRLQQRYNRDVQTGKIKTTNSFWNIMQDTGRTGGTMISSDFIPELEYVYKSSYFPTSIRVEAGKILKDIRGAK